eukprot:12901155-Prorocentrum_lima.AAC.1
MEWISPPEGAFQRSPWQRIATPQVLLTAGRECYIEWALRQRRRCTRSSALAPVPPGGLSPAFSTARG